MLITDDLLDGFVGQGGPFESLLHSLIRAEAWACAVRPDHIDWDYRTNVGDGSREVLIRSAMIIPPGSLSPASLRSGRLSQVLAG